MKVVFVFLFALLVGCAESSNNSVAFYKKVEGAYEITMVGKRAHMAHDPISFLFRGSSPSKAILKVPRIKGNVKGEEIPVKKGYYSFVGDVDFIEHNMKVDLFYDDYDKNVKREYSWNGEYKLREIQ